MHSVADRRGTDETDAWSTHLTPGFASIVPPPLLWGVLVQSEVWELGGPRRWGQGTARLGGKPASGLGVREQRGCPCCCAALRWPPGCAARRGRRCQTKTRTGYQVSHGSPSGSMWARIMALQSTVPSSWDGTVAVACRPELYHCILLPKHAKLIGFTKPYTLFAHVPTGPYPLHVRYYWYIPYLRMSRLVCTRSAYVISCPLPTHVRPPRE